MDMVKDWLSESEMACRSAQSQRSAYRMGHQGMGDSKQQSANQIDNAYDLASQLQVNTIKQKRVQYKRFLDETSI